MKVTVLVREPPCPTPPAPPSHPLLTHLQILMAAAFWATQFDVVALG